MKQTFNIMALLLIYLNMFFIAYYKYQDQDFNHVVDVFETRIEHKGIGTDVIIECGIDLLFVMMVVTIYAYIFFNLYILIFKTKSKYVTHDFEIKNFLYALLFYVLCLILIHYFLEDRYLIITMYHMALEDNAEYYFELASENTIAKKGEKF